MRPTEVDPTVETTSQGEEYSHPAYGQIQVSRIQGQRTLYGSDFIHHNYVAIRVKHSSLNRNLSRDWHFDRGEIVEVHLSEAQWAAFVSSMNVGSGVPCTLNHLSGKMVPGIPQRAETDHYRFEFPETVQKAITEIEQTLAEIQTLSVTKLKKNSLSSKLRMAAQHLVSNLPFVARSFDEHMETAVEKAKLEVNAYLTQAINRAGLEALRGKTPFTIGHDDDTKLIEHQE